MVNSVYNNQFISSNYNFQKPTYNYNVNRNLNLKVYSSDSLTLSNNTPIVPKDPSIGGDTDPIPYEPSKPSFFNRPEVRVGAMMLGTGAVGAGLGYAVGSAFGRAGLGAAIGGGIGVVAPIAMIAYALWAWGRNH